MNFELREYTTNDRKELVRCMEELQDYIVSVDALKRVRRALEFGEVYTKWLLGVIAKENGIIYFAEQDGKVVGCVAGMLPPQSLAEQAGGIPSEYGRVQELYVDEKYRGQGIGQALMKKMEEYFRGKGCDIVYVDVFAPNKNAYEFYRECGYADRDINLMKRL